jgi:hypothetical protein
MPSRSAREQGRCQRRNTREQVGRLPNDAAAALADMPEKGRLKRRRERQQRHRGTPTASLRRVTRVAAPESEPEQDGREGQHREVISRPLLVAGGDPAVLLEAVDEALDDIALAVRTTVKTRV